MRSPFVKAGALAVGASALTMALALPAAADPGQPVAATDITAVGSDTIQFLDDHLATGYNATNPARLFNSWDAVNPVTKAVHDSITIKPGVSIVRPNGSNEGIAELKKTGTQVEIARSSRGPQAGDEGLLFLPVAQDEVRYALSKHTPSNGVDGITAAQLKRIYQCGLQGSTAAKWSDVGGTSTNTIKAYVPQPGSGTRSFFEKSIGVSDDDVKAGVRGGCITESQEHDPAPVQDNADALAPFSVAQAKSVVPAGQIMLNSTGFSATREVYNVVKADADGNVPATLRPLVGDGSANSGWVCGTDGQNIVTTDGFSKLSNCGVAEYYGG